MKITSSSTAEYFAKNLQQVGFSSPTKAVLTTLKEAVDNSLDACEEAGILPDIDIDIELVKKGSGNSADVILIKITDNGPGLEADDVVKVFGQYLASSKFGKGQCSRGQQGIGISAATTWAQLTNAKGATVVSKTARMKKALVMRVDVDIKNNKGTIREKKTKEHKQTGISVQFQIDGRVRLNGDGGIKTYIEGTALVNPHASIKYKILDNEEVTIDRVSDDMPKIPSATLPHPHTMKLGEFIAYRQISGKMKLKLWLRQGFSRVTDNVIAAMVKNGLPKATLQKPLLSEEEIKKVYRVIQNTELLAPSTKSVLTIGEKALSKSIQRLGEIDFFSVVTRKPRVCDHKPVVVEVAISRFKNKSNEGQENSVQVLRFANRVPLQFDKASCAITKAIESVNWKSYGLTQSKNSVPCGPYVFAISIVSPFIKFKNASKETIDASEELVEEIRRTLMQTGQKLSRHIKAEIRAEELEKKVKHIEQFGPILVDGLVRILKAPKSRHSKAQAGLLKLLSKDTKIAEKILLDARNKLSDLEAKHGE